MLRDLHSFLSKSRRSFLKFLAQSPALALAGQSTYKFAGRGDGPIASPDEAINVFDFEVLAQKNLDPAHWGYLSTGTDDDGTIRANRDGFSRFQLRPRRLVDVRRDRYRRPRSWDPVVQPHRARPHRATARVSSRRRDRRRPRRSRGESSSDSFDRHFDRSRGRARGPRRADLVPALRRVRLGNDPRSREAGGESGLHGGRAHGGPPGRQQPGDGEAIRAPRRPRVLRVPSERLRRLHTHQADVRRARCRRAIPTSRKASTGTS